MGGMAILFLKTIPFIVSGERSFDISYVLKDDKKEMTILIAKIVIVSG